MSISKVWIIDGCISCGACESIAPDVFTVEDIAEIKPDIDFDDFEEDIAEAADGCPVSVIKYE